MCNNTVVAKNNERHYFVIHANVSIIEYICSFKHDSGKIATTAVVVTVMNSLGPCLSHNVQYSLSPWK